jgi:hypothetical protein
LTRESLRPISKTKIKGVSRKAAKAQRKDKPERKVSLANSLKNKMLLQGLIKVFTSIPSSFFKASAIEFLCVLGGFARDRSL